MNFIVPSVNIVYLVIRTYALAVNNIYNIQSEFKIRE